jgi:formyltetrahydrofolate-dependent phosphoribosylglycinamide formyltransferase
MKRLAVLVSGSGTNLQAIIDATADGRLPAQVVLVASNKRKAFGLERARRAGIPTLVLGLKKFLAAGHDRQQYDAELARRVAEVEPDLVVLAGWMLILGPAFLERFPRRVLNLHPALPGTFPGMHAIERAHEAFQRGGIDHTGVMVHWVIPEVDAGEPLATAEVPIYREDTLDDLEQRVHQTEHRLLVQAIAEALEGLA